MVDLASGSEPSSITVERGGLRFDNGPGRVDRVCLALLEYASLSDCISTAGWVRTPDGACGVLKLSPQDVSLARLPLHRTTPAENLVLNLLGVDVSSPATGRLL